MLALHAAPIAASATTVARECPTNVSMDERALCFLGTPAGRRALATVGEAAAGDLETRKAHAALTPSFARYVIRTAGLAKAQPALEGASKEAFAKHTGRSLAEWRADWVAAIGGAPSAGG
ncbi:hypothetical protein rosag_07690 [Roseisolibacter agri]|uniref:Uncharacterized protein n=2 Tax=Roseisolibacter agri TaxID=2014610 RepID=A0AA37Q766_9BACT|nr:hypothetical protein rosag_07690 [Roseisolibacter agri]